MYGTADRMHQRALELRREREETLDEHESHATAVLRLLFADSGGDGYGREKTPRGEVGSIPYRRNRVRDQVEREGRE